jgi:hypothetical protein
MDASPIQELAYAARGYTLKIVLWPTQIETFVKKFGYFAPDRTFPIANLRELRWLSRWGLALVFAETAITVFSDTKDLETFCTNCRELNSAIAVNEENKARLIPKSNKKAALLVLGMLILLIIVASYVKRIHFPD